MVYVAIETRQREFESFILQYMKKARPQEALPTPTVDTGEDAIDLTDDEIIQRLQDKPKTAQLWAGDLSDYNGDHSKADAALLSSLAFWTRKNAIRMAELFSLSALGQREKWTDRPDYRERSIKAAIDACREVYRGNSLRGSGGYFAKGYAIFFKKTIGGEAIDVRLTNFLPQPKREITLDDGASTPTMLFEIAGTLETGEALPPVTVEARHFAALNWIKEAWGLRPYVAAGTGNKEKLRFVIEFAARNIKREYVYAHLGWRRLGGKWVYLHSGGAVGAEGVKVQAPRLEQYRLPDQGTTNPKEAVALALSLLDVAPRRVTVPLLAMVFLAPLREFLMRGGADPSFLLFLLGRTQAMKSTLAALFLSFYGQFDRNSLPASFRDTSNAIERVAFSAKDSLLVIDDLHPAQNALEQRRMAQTLQTLSRGYGDRAGRMRLDSDARNVREANPPRGLGIITGEDLPGLGQSAFSRFLILDISAGEVDITRLTAAQERTGELPAIMRSYIEYLAQQAEEADLVTNLRSIFVKRRVAASTSTFRRLPEITAWLETGFTAFICWAVTNGGLDRKGAENYAAQALAVLDELQAAHEGTIKTEAPEEKFKRAFTEMLATGAIKFAELPYQELGPNYVGWYDNDFYYCLPETLYAAVNRFHEAQGGSFPVKAATLWKGLASAGVLEAGTGGRVAKAKWIDGQGRYLLWIRKGLGA